MRMYWRVDGVTCNINFLGPEKKEYIKISILAVLLPYIDVDLDNKHLTRFPNSQSSLMSVHRRGPP